MYPILFEFEGRPRLPAWGIMVMLAFIVACLVLGARAGKIGIDPDRLMPFFVLITFGGLFGSRLLHFLMASPPRSSSHPLDFFNLSKGGFAFYGGAIFSTLAGAIYALRARIPAWKLADAWRRASCSGGHRSARVLLRGMLPRSRGRAAKRVDAPPPARRSIVTTDGFPFLALVFRRAWASATSSTAALPDAGLGVRRGVPPVPPPLVGVEVRAEVRRPDDATLLLTYPILRTAIESFRGDSVRGTRTSGCSRRRRSSRSRLRHRARYLRVPFPDRCRPRDRDRLRRGRRERRRLARALPAVLFVFVPLSASEEMHCSSSPGRCPRTGSGAPRSRRRPDLRVLGVAVAHVVDVVVARLAAHGAREPNGTKRARRCMGLPLGS